VRRRAGLPAALAAVAAFLLAAPPASAANCSVTVAASVAFGTYDPLDTAPLDTTGTITYRCSANVPTVTIDIDRGNATTYFPRRMLNGVETLSYNLFLDVARTQVWGDGTGGTSHFGPAPAGMKIDVPVYGRIPALQDAAEGAFADTVVVTINY